MNDIPKDYRDYEEKPIVDALHACASGDFSRWTIEQHQAFGDWVTRHPHALAGALCAYLDAHLPDHIRRTLNLDARAASHGR